MTPEQEKALALARARRAREAATGGLPADVYQPGDPWSGFDPARDAFKNPVTGQMTTRELLANQYRPGAAMSGVSGATQGMYFGADDEINGAAAAALNPGMGTAAERYRFGREDYLAQLEAARRDHPVAAYGGEIAGAVASPVNKLLPGGKATNLRGKVGEGAMAGALGGGLYGFASGDGGLADRATNAAVTAMLGGAVGGAVPGVMDAARKAGSMAIGAMGRANVDAAQAYLNELAMRSGKTPAQLQAEIAAAAADGQPGYMMADALGATGQAALSGVTRQPGPARQLVTDLLNGRQEGQGRRISTFVADHFGFGGDPSLPSVPNTPESVLGAGTTSAAKLADDLRTARGNAANAAYDASRAGAGPVDTSGVVSLLDQRLAGTKGNEFARNEVDDLYQGLRNSIASTKGDQTTYLSDYTRLLQTKQALGDQIAELTRAGKNYAASEMIKVKNALDAALETASQGYRKANDDFRAASRVVDAVETGQQMPKTGLASDNVAAFGAMKPTEQSAARIGYGDTLLRQVEDKTGTSNRAGMFSADGLRDEIAAVAKDPGGFFTKIDRENTMFGTRTRATGGSMTADNLADQAASRDIVPTVMNAATLNVSGLIRQAADKLASAASGRNAATREVIAQLLMSKTPAQALAPALASAAQRAARDAKTGRFIRPAANAIVSQLLSGR